MDEQPSEEDAPEPRPTPSGTATAPEPRRTSAWPFVVALGLTVSEIGVFLAVYPLAVGGLVLFVASVAGIVYEAGYTERPWRLAGGLGAILVLAGVWVVSTQIALAPDALVSAVDRADGIVLRGFSIAAAGLVATIGAGILTMYEAGDDDAFPA